MADLNDIKLSTQDILKKQFKNKVKGFDPDEVDAYLDQVIADYETFQQIIEDLYGQIGQLQRQLLEQQKKVQATRSANFDDDSEQIKTYSPHKSRTSVFNSEPDSTNQGNVSTNMEIIRRISTLERKVYRLEQNARDLQNQ